MESLRQTESWKWWHGVLFYVVVEALSVGLGGLVRFARSREQGVISTEAQQAYYKAQNLPVFSPPGWLFPIAWTINNVSVIWGILRVLNKPAGSTGRDAYLALQAATWVDYVLFNTAYFALRSPINALVLTVIYLILTVSNLMVALFRLKDSKVALSLGTLVMWLLIAVPTAYFQSRWNRDPFYQVGPFAEPPAGWVKEKQG